MVVAAFLALSGLRTGHPLNLGHGKAYVLLIVLLLFCLSQFYFAKKKAFLGPLHKSPSILSTLPEYLKASPSPPLPPSFPLFCSACPLFVPPSPYPLSPPPFPAPREEHSLGSYRSYNCELYPVLRKILQVIERRFCHCPRLDCEGRGVSGVETELPHHDRPCRHSS